LKKKETKMGEHEEQSLMLNFSTNMTVEALHSPTGWCNLQQPRIGFEAERAKPPHGKQVDRSWYMARSQFVKRENDHLLSVCNCKRSGEEIVAAMTRSLPASCLHLTRNNWHCKDNECFGRFLRAEEIEQLMTKSLSIRRNVFQVDK
jgi:hypothetical protein